MRNVIDRQSQLIFGRGDHIDKLYVSLAANVAQFRGWVQGNSHYHHRVVQHVQPPGARRGFRAPDGASVLADVVGNLSVKIDRVGISSSQIPCGRGKNKILMIALPHAHAAMFEVDRLFVFRYADPFLRRIRRSRDIAPSIHIRRFTVAFENDRLYSENAFPSTQSLGGTGNQANAHLRLLLRIHRQRGNDSYEGKQCEQACFLHNKSTLSAGYFFAGFFQRE